MNKYLLLLHEQVEQMKNLSPKEMQELITQHMDWANQLAEKGQLVSGDGLEEKSITIKGKESMVNDSMYLEAKEMIGGYYLIQAATLEMAIEIAKQCPCHHWGGTTEIRPIANYEEA
jgi:hypothetical protein